MLINYFSIFGQLLIIQEYLQEDIWRNLRTVAKQIKLHKFEKSILHKIN